MSVFFELDPLFERDGRTELQNFLHNFDGFLCVLHHEGRKVNASQPSSDVEFWVSP